MKSQSMCCDFYVSCSTCSTTTSLESHVFLKVNIENRHTKCPSPLLSIHIYNKSFATYRCTYIQQWAKITWFGSFALRLYVDAFHHCGLWSILFFDPLVFCCLIKSIFASRLSLTICRRWIWRYACLYVIELMCIRKCTQCIAYPMMDSHGNALNLGRG